MTTPINATEKLVHALKAALRMILEEVADAEHTPQVADARAALAAFETQKAIHKSSND